MYFTYGNVGCRQTDRQTDRRAGRQTAYLSQTYDAIAKHDRFRITIACANVDLG